MNFMIVPGILVCSSFLISVCMFIVWQTSLISSTTVIVRAEGAIWLNPFAKVLFNVCSALSVEWCAWCPCCVSGFGMLAVMYLILIIYLFHFQNIIFLLIIIIHLYN